jgi:hypothetical protein
LTGELLRYLFSDADNSAIGPVMQFEDFSGDDIHRLFLNIFFS